MKLSIITIAFNAEETIEETVQSVLSQNCAGFDLEYLLIDGASSDSTLDILSPYSNRITLISEPDKGIYDAMNKGIEKASGDYIGILNADDVYADDDVLQHVMDVFRASGSDSVYGDLVYVQRDNLLHVTRTWISGSFKLNAFRNGWMPPHPTFFVHKKIYDRLGSFHPQLKLAADYELMLRFLFKAKITTSYLPKTLVRMRVGGASNTSIRNRWLAHAEDRE